MGPKKILGRKGIQRVKDVVCGKGIFHLLNLSQRSKDSLSLKDGGYLINA